MPWAVLHCADGEEPEKVLHQLLEHGRMQPLEGGGWLLGGTEDDRRRQTSRRRQQRYRDRQRASADVTRSDAAGVTRSYAPTDEELVQLGGAIRSLSPLLGEEREIEAPNVTRSYARNDDARDARNDDARDARDREDDQPGSPWRIEPLTDEQRETAQRKIRELREELHRARKP